jgi:WD40 repeat protein
VGGSQGQGRWKHHFFVSYVAVDLEWAEWVAWTLEEAGYRVTLRQWDLTPGSHDGRYLNDALREAERVMAIVSLAYLTSSAAAREWLTAAGSDPAGFARRVVPVRIDDAAPDGLLGGLVAIELGGLREAQAREKLLDRLQAVRVGRAKPARSPRYPGTGGLVRPTAAPRDASGPAVGPGEPARAAFVRDAGRAGDELARAGGRGSSRPAALAELPHTGVLGRVTRLIWVGALAFAGDGDLLITGADDGVTRLWDIRDPSAAVLVARFRDHAGWVRAVAVDPVLGLLVSGGADGMIVLRDLTVPAAPRPVAKIAAGASKVWTAAFAPGAGLLAAGGEGRALKVWAVDDGRLSRVVYERRPSGGSFGALAFGPGGRLLAGAGSGTAVQVWSLEPGDLEPGDSGPGQTRPIAVPAPTTLTGHDAAVWALTFSPTRELLASGSDDATIALWRPSGGEGPEPMAVALGHRGPVRSLAFSPDGALLASAGDDDTVRVWDARRPELPRAVYALSGFGGRATAVAFSPAGDLLAVGGSDGKARLYRV